MYIQILPQCGHWVVYMNGEFFCTADTYGEAAREIENARINNTK